MMRNRWLRALVALLVVLWVGVAVTAADEPSELDLLIYRLASFDDLVGSGLATLESKNSGEGLFVAVFPETGFAAVIRPLTESEFGSYQVQAIALEAIELQMVAAAVVFPALSAEDVGAITQETLVLLKRAINEVSDLIIFGDAEFPQG